MSATARPWAVHPHFPEYIVPADHINRPMGGSVDEDFDRDHYANIIAEARAYGEFDKFAHHSSKVDARLTAALIVRAVNLHDELVRALEDAFMALGRCGPQCWNDHQVLRNRISGLINKAKGEQKGSV